MLRTSPDACPLCGAPPAPVVSVIRLAEVWRAYQEQYATSFSDKVLAKYGNGPISLRRCGRCGLEWFDPGLEGDADFYSQLFTGRINYEPWRWEFDHAAKRVPHGAHVVEVGAGEGAFLRSVLPRCRSAEVLDKNPDVAPVLRAVGVQVSHADVREDALARPNRADVVCAFQVLEHVADVRGFLCALAAIVVPGGEILLSVPNRERFREHLEPMDCPPHHLSRWGPGQLSAAADLMGLELVHVSFESPPLSHTRAARQRPVRRALAPVTGPWLAQQAARAIARLRMPNHRHARLTTKGGFPARGEYGHTMFAALRRPR